MPKHQRPVMIGQAPNGDLGEPCTGQPYLRMARTLGWRTIEAQVEFLEQFERRTLLDERPVPISGNGESFPMPDAREAAQMMRKDLEGRTVFMVGRAVADAFGLGNYPLFEWKDDCPSMGARTVVIPHPSGKGFWWNDEVNRNRARSFFKEFVREESVVEATP